MSAVGQPRPWSLAKHWTEDELSNGGRRRSAVMSAEPLPEGAVNRVAVDHTGRCYQVVVVGEDVYDAAIAPFVANDPTYPPAHISFFEFEDQRAA